MVLKAVILYLEELITFYRRILPDLLTPLYPLTPRDVLPRDVFSLSCLAFQASPWCSPPCEVLCLAHLSLPLWLCLLLPKEVTQSVLHWPAISPSLILALGILWIQVCKPLRTRLHFQYTLEFLILICLLVGSMKPFSQSLIPDSSIVAFLECPWNSGLVVRTMGYVRELEHDSLRSSKGISILLLRIIQEP